MSEGGTSRREQILAAARELLAERGPAGSMTLDDVVRRAGTTKATLYRYFPSKAALLAELRPGAAKPPGRREVLLDAALQVVRRHGLAGATTERIAAEAGLSPAALYWHFESKDALLLALVRRATARLGLAELLAGHDPEPELLLGELAPRGMALQTEHVELLGAVLAEAIARPELAAEVYDGVIVPIWGGLSRYFERAAQAGTLRPGHPMLQVVAMVGMITFYNLSRRAFGPRLELPPPEQAARELAEIFMHGVLPTPRRQP